MYPTGRTSAPTSQEGLCMTGVQSSRRGWIVLGGCAIFFLLVAIAHSAEEGSAATIVVPDNYPTIQGAIDSARDGDVVDVRRGNYGERLTIDKSITLKGAKEGSTTIEVVTSDAILTLEAKDILVSNIEILGSDGSIGIYANDLEYCRLVDVSIRGCGYGIYIEHGSYLEIERCSFRSCSNAALFVTGNITKKFEHLSLFDSLFEQNSGNGIVLERCRFVELDDILVFKNQGLGLTTFMTSLGHLRNSTLNYNDHGLQLIDSHGWSIEDNVISMNRWNGIELNQSGSEIVNVVLRNEIRYSSRQVNSTYAGIAFVGMGAADNLLERNFIRYNPVGVSFNSASGGCWHNTFNLNEFRACDVAIWESSGTGPNTFTLNIFEDNSVQAARLHGDSAFDDGERGNFWGDYIQRYPIAKRDGLIWNTPYTVITGFAVVDRFPLVYTYEDDPPVIELGWDLDVTFGISETIIILADDDSAIDTYEWTVIGPGGAETTYTTAGPTFRITFVNIGQFWISVTVTDVWGTASKDSIYVNVIDDQPPLAVAGEDLAVDLGKPVTLDGTGSSDNQGIATIHWVVDPDGLDLRFYTSIVTLTIDALGRYTAILFLTDHSGNSASNSLTITIHDLSPPKAVVRGDTTISLGERRTFDGILSHDNVGIVSWRWTLIIDGKKSFSEGLRLTHTFNVLGSFTVGLEVTDAAGRSDIAGLLGTVIDTEMPVAVAGEDMNVPMGTDVLFNATSSTDNVGIWRYSWTFTYDFQTHRPSGRTFRWRFDIPGEYQVFLMVYDAAKNINTDVLKLTVYDPDPPVAKLVVPREAELGTSLVLDASLSVDNVDVVTYEWRVTHKDDSITLRGMMASLDLEEAGAYRVTLTVRDAAGNEDVVEGSLYVPPKATEAERPAWLAPVMVLVMIAAVLAGYVYARKRFEWE